ncbi:MAG: tetratricopeptide repeat protein [candidate division WOR-3 bacterium]
MVKHKKKDLKRDEFKEAIQELIIFYKHHRKVFIGIIIGIVATLILSFSYRKFKISRFERSKEQYNIAVALFDNGRFEEAKSRFKLLTEEYWGTIFANRAVFMLACISYKEGNLDEAISKFQDFLKTKYDELFTPNAYEGLAQCYEQKGDFQKAIENYKIALDKFKNNLGKAECMISLARIYLAEQKIEEAKKMLKEVIETSENYEIIREAERKLKLIQVQEELNE